MRIGVCKYKGKSEYDGDWVDDAKHGKGYLSISILGIFKYANGDKYDGDWKHDKRDGKGSLHL